MYIYIENLRRWIRSPGQDRSDLVVDSGPNSFVPASCLFSLRKGPVVGRWESEKVHRHTGEWVEFQRPLPPDAELPTCQCFYLVLHLVSIWDSVPPRSLSPSIIRPYVPNVGRPGTGSARGRSDPQARRRPGSPVRVPSGMRAPRPRPTFHFTRWTAETRRRSCQRRPTFFGARSGRGPSAAVTGSRGRRDSDSSVGRRRRCWR